jgi:hypothetical protein
LRLEVLLVVEPGKVPRLQSQDPKRVSEPQTKQESTIRSGADNELHSRSLDFGGSAEQYLCDYCLLILIFTTSENKRNSRRNASIVPCGERSDDVLLEICE